MRRLMLVLALVTLSSVAKAEVATMKRDAIGCPNISASEKLYEMLKQEYAKAAGEIMFRWDCRNFTQGKKVVAGRVYHDFIAVRFFGNPDEYYVPTADVEQ